MYLVTGLLTTLVTHVVHASEGSSESRANKTGKHSHIAPSHSARPAIPVSGYRKSNGEKLFLFHSYSFHLQFFYYLIFTTLT